MARIIEPLREMGARVESETEDMTAPLVFSGGDLHGIEYAMPVASAQVKSALLLAGLRAEGRTTLHQPAASRDHTERMLASMGAGLPSAMAAILLHTGRRVLAVCGDGGFLMNSQELEPAVRLGLNLVVVILNDSSYGMIRWKQQGMCFTDFGLEFQNPDFVSYAESY